MPEPLAVAVPRAVVPSVAYKVTVAPDSAPPPLIVGVVSFVKRSLVLPLLLAASRARPVAIFSAAAP